ncbi:MAG TPA: class I SAM-dependent methyltransferase, partial [Pyrinomonadaceae bacterium]|nr:class I SAM-dependent methyltransferase [Pyrinomonadaceae bacterium]
AKAETQTTEAERDCLSRQAAGRKRLVEIGVWHGVTTHRLRSVMSPEGVLLGIDPYPPGRLGFSAQWYIARTEVSKISNGSMQWVRLTGIEAAQRYAADAGEPVDFIFIDGDHSYDGLRGDWEAWSGLVAPGGIVALHDSCSSATRQIDDAGSAVYTRNVILKDGRFEKVEAVDTLIIMRRKSCD